MKSYSQYCPVAHALDLVGERWALLIVRELMLGQRRYTDLAEALPKIGTNILAARLRDLEAAGIVRKAKLPPPAAVSVYELTDTGRALDSGAPLTRPLGRADDGRAGADRLLEHVRGAGAVPARCGRRRLLRDSLRRGVGDLPAGRGRAASSTAMKLPADEPELVVERQRPRSSTR